MQTLVLGYVLQGAVGSTEEAVKTRCYFSFLWKPEFGQKACVGMYVF